MTIAIIGPEKFAFQDLVCIDLALETMGSGHAAMIPEPAGHEDATISWSATENAPAALVEVQVKGASGTADIATLANYLLHYPDRATKGSLLERVMDSKYRAALFVISARCADDLAPLLLDCSPRALADGRAVKAHVGEALRAAVRAISEKAVAKNATKLKTERHANVKELATRPLADFERAVSRIAIVESESAEKIEVKLHAALKQRRFATLSIRGIIASLSDHLNNAKRNQVDVIPAFQLELRNRAPEAVSPTDYLNRGIEAELSQQLELERALLISGPPRAGKSWTARHIGGKLQELGFEIRGGGHIDEAERFLTDPIAVDRAYILDDPLGAREQVFDASARLGALRGLIERLTPNRRLVVAQTESVLLQTRGTASLTECALGSWSWFTIQPLSAERAVTVWRAAAADQGIDQIDVDRVVAVIERNEELRDPGALAYLAQTFVGLPANPSDAELLFQARNDAVDFARTLAASSLGHRSMLSAAAISTEPGQAVAITELAFIANGGEVRPGLAPKDNVIELGADRRLAPVYEEHPELTESQNLALDNLQRRRMLSSSERGLNFTHPYLRAGAQALLRPEISTDIDSIVELAGRTLACVDPSTSLAGARNLRWLRAAVPSETRSNVFEVACTGVRSLFPATRDACFAFLIDMADELSPEQRHLIPYWAARVSIQLEDIDVESGLGFITGQPDVFAVPSPVKEIAPYLSALEAGEPLGLDLALSRRILLTLNGHPEVMNAAVCRRFLRADEAVVRGAAAGAWFAIQREDDADIIEWFADDRAPAISRAILDTVSNNWETINDHRREVLTEMLRAQAMSPGCASVMLNRLVLFNRVEHFGHNPPWSLFAKLMPTVIEHLPLSVSFRDGRFNLALDDALEAITPELLSPLVEAWATRLQRRIAYRTLDEFELSIAGPLLAAIPPARRLTLLRDLFGVADTGARVVTMKWLIADWKELSLDERSLISEVLNEDRPDSHWIAATVLTCTAPPKLLVEQLTGDADLLDGSVETIETELGPKLFEACFRMFRGDPQPLWWYATHHSDNQTWPRIVRSIATSPFHRLFDEAYLEIAMHGDKGELRAVIDALPEEALMHAFELLLHFKLSCTGFWRKESWVLLLERADEAGLLDEMFEQIDAVSDGILEGLRDIKFWLGDSPYAERLLKLYPHDAATLVGLLKIEELCKQISQAGPEETEAETGEPALILRAYIANVLDQFQAAPCRLFSSWDALSIALRNSGGDEELDARIDQGRMAAIKRHQKLGKAARDVTSNVSLGGWVYGHKNDGG